MQEIITMIASVGFPIVACVGMAYGYAKKLDAMREDILLMSGKLDSVMKEVEKDGI